MATKELPNNKQPKGQSTEQQTLSGVANLLLLQQRLRAMPNVAELGSMVVNDTRLLIQYRSAVLWLDNKVTAVSGLPEPVKHAPFTMWIAGLCRHANAQVQEQGDAEPLAISPNDLPSDISDDWNEYLPKFALWVPLLNREGDVLGGLFLVRETQWKEEEQRLFKHWGEAIAHAVYALSLRPIRWSIKLEKRTRTMVIAGVAAFVFLLMWVPVQLSVLAPGEVVPKTPLVVRAQIDGVVGEVFVKPNQEVTVGDLLVRLDASSLNARMDVARQELEIARAELLRAEQASVADQQASSQVPMLKAQIRKKDSELNYVKTLLGRVEIRAERPGIAIIPDVTKLEGLPVKVGQRLMVLAEPTDGELEAWLPVGDSLKLNIGSPVKLYLNISPTQPLEASLRRVDYQAQISPEGILAFRLRASFKEGAEPSVGWRGTAKIYGEDAPLIYYLMRRPFAAARQWLGL